MPLDRETRDTIEQFVKQKPRAMQEISEKIGKSWRTADRYTRQMEDEDGIIKRRTFREGTRGALKIVYWNTVSDVNQSTLQEQLLTKIESGREKTDFSPFDIYQCADHDERHAFAEHQRDENVETEQDLFGKLRQAQQEILFFSGNLSWVNTTEHGEQAMDVFRELAEDGISLNFIGRVDIDSTQNTQKLLDLNKALPQDKISVRHVEQPLRSFIVDDKIVQFKEMRQPDENDANGKRYLFYEITDNEWIDWIQQVYWKLYRGAIPADRRLEDLKTIKNIRQL